MVMVTLVPGLPTNGPPLHQGHVDGGFLADFSNPIPVPAAAGVPSMGEITVRKPSRLEMTIPKPPNSPRVDIFISRETLGSSRTE